MACVTYVQVRPPRKFPQVEALVGFMLDNPLYFEVVCAIILQCKKRVQYSKSLLESMVVANGVPLSGEASNRNELDRLLSDFYDNVDRGVIANRRGAFLEELIDQTGPYSHKSVRSMHRESQIFFNGRKIYGQNKDLDFIYEFDDMDIEIHECKVDADGVMTRLRDDDLEKIAYLEFVVDFFEKKQGSCSAFIPSLSEVPDRTLTVLKVRKVKILTVTQIRQKLA